MGLPARKIDAPTPLSPANKRVAKRPAASRRSCPEAAARRIFRSFVLLIVVFCALGLGRVWLSVQAAEASLEAAQLRGLIKTERYRGDMLEVQQSALSSPSRIRAIAGATMDMASSGEATYVRLESPERDVEVAKSDAPSALQRALTDVLSLAAGEAQVMLVGDVGLASAR